MRLLIVEDNKRLASLLADELSKQGFASDLAPDLAYGEVALGTAAYDAIVLDLGLPDGDGLKRMMTWRALGQLPPVLVLTARGALEDRISGLDAGADDYMVKPVEIGELAARLRALLRRPGPRASPVLEVGSLRFDTAARTASYKDVELDLSRREADLLEVVMSKAGTVVRRSAIVDALYTFDEPVTPNAVEATVSRLRRKLEDAGGTGLLHTVRGVGYLLRARQSG